MSSKPWPIQGESAAIAILLAFVKGAGSDENLPLRWSQHAERPSCRRSERVNEMQYVLHHQSTPSEQSRNEAKPMTSDIKFYQVVMSE